MRRVSKQTISMHRRKRCTWDCTLEAYHAMQTTMRDSFRAACGKALLLTCIVKMRERRWHCSCKRIPGNIHTTENVGVPAQNQNSKSRSRTALRARGYVLPWQRWQHAPAPMRHNTCSTSASPLTCCSFFAENQKNLQQSATTLAQRQHHHICSP